MSSDEILVSSLFFPSELINFWDGSFDLYSEICKVVSASLWLFPLHYYKSSCLQWSKGKSLSEREKCHPVHWLYCLLIHQFSTFHFRPSFMSELCHVYLLMLQIKDKKKSPQNIMHSCRLSTGLFAPKTLSASFFFAPTLTSPVKLQMTTLNICRILSANSLSVFFLCVCVCVAFSGSVSQGQRPSEKSSGHPREQGQTSQEIW